MTHLPEILLIAFFVAFMLTMIHKEKQQHKHKTPFKKDL